MSLGSKQRRSATATTMSSTARKPGAHGASTQTGFFASCAPTQPPNRHAGLSYLLVPADAPGMTRRTIKRLDQESGFAEIFFDDCRVSADHVLGEPGQGWAVAMAAAGSERGLSLRSPGRFMAGCGASQAARHSDRCDWHSNRCDWHSDRCDWHSDRCDWHSDRCDWISVERNG